MTTANFEPLRPSVQVHHDVAAQRNAKATALRSVLGEDAVLALRHAAVSGNDTPIPVEARDLGNPIAGVSDKAPDAFADRVIAYAAAASTVLRLGAPVVPTERGALAVLPVAVDHDTFQGVSFGGSKVFTAPVKTSTEFLSDAVSALFDSIMPMHLGNAVGALLAVDLMTGTGTAQPQGLVTGATPVAAAAAALSANDFKALFSAVPTVHRNQAVWLMSTATYFVATTLGVVDANPNGGPGHIYGLPVELDDLLPSVASGARPVVLADVSSGYLVRQVGPPLELLTVEAPSDFATDQVTLAARLRADGRVVNTTAVKALVMP